MTQRTNAKEATPNEFDAYYLGTLPIAFKNYLNSNKYDDWTVEDLKKFVQLYVDYRNEAIDYRTGNYFGFDVFSASEDSSNNSTRTDTLSDPNNKLEFDDFWQAGYDDMEIADIKLDMNDAGYFLYDVEAFFELMYGEQGAFTTYYNQYGLGAPIDMDVQIPDNYAEFLRYTYSADDELWAVTTLQKYLYKIQKRAAELIKEDQDEDVDVIKYEDIFNQDLMALIEY